MKKLNLMLLQRAVSALERIADYVTTPLLNVDEDGAVTAVDQRFTHAPTHGLNDRQRLVEKLDAVLPVQNSGFDTMVLVDADTLWRARNFIADSVPIPPEGFNAELIAAWDEVREAVNVEPIAIGTDRTQTEVRAEVVERVRALATPEDAPRDDGSSTAIAAAPGAWVALPGTDIEVYFPAIEMTLFNYRRRPRAAERAEALASAFREVVSRRLAGGADIKEPLVQELLAAVSRAAPDKAGLHAVRMILGLGRTVDDATTIGQLRSLMDSVVRLRDEVGWPGRPENAYPWAVLEHVHGRVQVLQRHFQRTNDGPSAAVLIDERNGVIYLQTAERLYRPVTSIDDDGRPITGGRRVIRDEIDAK